MRLYDLLHNVVMNFAEMDPSEAERVKADAIKDYDERLAEAKSKQINNAKRVEALAKQKENPGAEIVVPPYQQLNKIDTLILKAEGWVMRYGVAIAYIVIMPLIRSWMNNGTMGDDDNEDKEFEKMMGFFAKYRAAKRA